jgi:polyferredoxin
MIFSHMTSLTFLRRRDWEERRWGERWEEKIFVRLFVFLVFYIYLLAEVVLLYTNPVFLSPPSNVRAPCPESHFACYSCVFLLVLLVLTITTTVRE